MILQRAHLLTYLLFLSLVTLEETTVCSGYSTVPSIMLGGITRRQDLHWKCSGKGNFAPWGVLDWIHGTSAGGGIEEDVAGEMEKHDVKEKADGAWTNAKDAGRRATRSRGWKS
jgi:hypothetical protein